MITEKRLEYRPFEYEELYETARNQQKVHWLKDEVNMASDITDWKSNLNSEEKELISKILKSFTQAEVLVGDYWRRVPQWFPKPEVAFMCSTFSYFETIHQDAYAYLNESLDLDDFKAFLQDEQAMNKLNYLIDAKSDTIEDKALSLAIFSAFTEGVLIYSSFGILLNFSRFDLLKKVGEIVKFSCRDEDIHSKGGILLFNILCNENPELRLKLEKQIIDSAKIIYDLEKSFIEQAFQNYNIKGITKESMLEFIKHRINVKLKELGYNELFALNHELLQQMEWFYDLTNARSFSDFFAARVNEYTKQSNINLNTMW